MAGGPVSIPSAETQAATTPDEVLERLRAGNRRFAAGEPTDRDLPAQVRAAVDGQHPLVAVLGCIDSRVPVEQVLDLGIGEAFVVRTAGNVVGDDVLGSLEFACALAGVKLVVVLGHTHCGAVKGAVEGVELGHLTGLLAKLAPAVVRAEADGAVTDDDLVLRTVELHVDDTVDTLTEQSSVLADLVASGGLRVTGAVYDLTTGRVAFR